MLCPLLLIPLLLIDNDVIRNPMPWMLSAACHTHIERDRHAAGAATGAGRCVVHTDPLQRDTISPALTCSLSSGTSRVDGIRER
jgi:hypothetical protein